MSELYSPIKTFIFDLYKNGIEPNVSQLRNGGAFIHIDIGNMESIDVVCTDRTNWKFMAGENCMKIGPEYRPGSYISDIDKLVEDIVDHVNSDADNVDDGDNEESLLSMQALIWLRSVNYGEKNHEQRMTLIEAAKILYP